MKIKNPRSTEQCNSKIQGVAGQNLEVKVEDSRPLLAKIKDSRSTIDYQSKIHGQQRVKS